MYVTNLLVELMIMLPGLAVYAYFVNPSVGFYVVFLLGSLFLPLLPLTISSILGAVITAVSSRTKHKSIVETVLMLAVVFVVLGGSLFLSDKESQLTEEMLKNMASVLSGQIGRSYPPALWFGDALLGDMQAFGLMIMIPTVIFAVFVVVLQKHFQSICAGIHAVSAKNNYKMTKLHGSSLLMALWKKELKRYFSSSVYVTNTLVGYFMAVIVAVGIYFVGIEQLMGALQLPNIDILNLILRCMPFGLSCLLCMTSITACSISMEGNTFWQIQTLPVTAKEYYDSKILANLSVAAPFYLISELLLILALKPVGLTLVSWIVIPACYLLFTSVTGISVNLMFPVLKWESEVRIVKQSASMFVTMLIGMLVSIFPILAILFAGEQMSGWICMLTVVVLLMATCLLYGRNQKTELVRIGV